MPPETNIATDHDHTVDPVLFADVRAFFLSLRCRKFLAARSLQNRTAALNDVGHASCVHVHDLFLKQSGIPPFDPLYGKTLCQCFTDNRPDRRVHSRCVTTACKNADRLYLFFHVKTLLMLIVIDLFILDVFLAVFNRLFNDFYVIFA